ncbi:MAG: hypothetical protein HN919_12225 [Verrucomicrobia bacterium]|nr:hypothetical protein [Verrucomicrobiota bacterium]MBT7067064.1 hypothetical protein [Verrucomicrobiota bacterium]MBT7700024.1 hypothetical protein [Verrucomicrobiota bacterium]
MRGLKRLVFSLAMTGAVALLVAGCSESGGTTGRDPTLSPPDIQGFLIAAHQDSFPRVLRSPQANDPDLLDLQVTAFGISGTCGGRVEGSLGTTTLFSGGTRAVAFNLDVQALAACYGDIAGTGDYTMDGGYTIGADASISGGELYSGKATTTLNGITADIEWNWDVTYENTAAGYGAYATGTTWQNDRPYTVGIRYTL